MYQHANHGGSFVPNGVPRRWDTDIVIGVAICLGVALLASAEKKKPKRGDSGLGPKALTPSSSVVDGMKVRSESSGDFTYYIPLSTVHINRS